MRILYYSAHPNLNLASPAGYGTHMREMITALKELGHEVLPVIMGGTSFNSIAGIAGKKNVLKEGLKKLTPIIIWETLKDYQLSKFDDYAFNFLMEAAVKFKPDLIFERAAYMQTSGVKAAANLGVKHILEMNSPYVEERLELQGKSLLLHKALAAEQTQLSKTDKIVVVSSALEIFFMRKYNLPESKFIVVPNAVNLCQVKEDQKRIAEISKKYSLSGTETVIGFVGSTFPWHGVDILVEAFSELSKEMPDLKLLIVGDGETLPFIKQKTAGLGLGTNVIFTGKVPHAEVYNYISLMSICVMAKSNWYGSPVKLFEYGALGKAVVAPDTIPVCDVMKHKVSGILVAPETSALIEAIKEYLADKSFMRSCANNFKQLVHDKHTWVQNAKAVLASFN